MRELQAEMKMCSERYHAVGQARAFKQWKLREWEAEGLMGGNEGEGEGEEGEEDGHVGMQQMQKLYQGWADGQGMA